MRIEFLLGYIHYKEETNDLMQHLFVFTCHVSCLSNKNTYSIKMDQCGMENQYTMYLMKHYKGLSWKQIIIIIYSLSYGCESIETNTNCCLTLCCSLLVWKQCNVSNIVDVLITVDFIKTCLDKINNYDVVLCCAINRCDAKSDSNNPPSRQVKE